MKTAGTHCGSTEMLRPRILYFGGDPYRSQVSIWYLTSCGFDVATAGNGDKEWSLVESAAGQFAFVIVDDDMPHTDGMDSLSLVTKLGSACFPAIIIVLIADGNPEPQCYKRLGVETTLRKPVRLWQLGQAVSRQSGAP